MGYDINQDLHSRDRFGNLVDTKEETKFKPGDLVMVQARGFDIDVWRLATVVRPEPTMAGMCYWVHTDQEGTKLAFEHDISLRKNP